MQQYLRVFGNRQPDNWVQWVLLVEFAVNNGMSGSMKCTPFFATQGMDSRMTFVGQPTHR
jgi:hypothetical protein